MGAELEAIEIEGEPYTIWQYIQLYIAPFMYYETLQNPLEDRQYLVPFLKDGVTYAVTAGAAFAFPEVALLAAVTTRAAIAAGVVVVYEPGIIGITPNQQS